MKLFPIVVSTALLNCLLVEGHSGAAQAELLDALRMQHPRLMATNDDFARITGLVTTDEHARRWHAQMKARAESMLDEPVAEYRLRDGRRLLYESKRVRDRVLTLAMLDKISPNDRYRDRVWADMQAAAGFKDWNPDHFLDVAVMSFAFAIAYDWMYDRWTDDQRATIRDAIVEHGITPGLEAYEQRVWWTRTHINWNQVCNGGLIAAALAIADERPQLATNFLTQAIESLRLPMSRYAPDGGYDEGPGYWAFGTDYNVFAIASLESALGTDFGLGNSPGFDVTAYFPQQMSGPNGDCFNFGDNTQKPVYSPTMFYFAKRYNQPGNAFAALRLVEGSPLDLLWYDPVTANAEVTTLPRTAVFKSAGVAAFRSDWHRKDAWYVAAKGGRIGFGHSQMDLGTFILDQGGVRWLIDLGSDDYNLPGYFSSDKGSKRWSYYVNRAEGHNTLVINPDKEGGQRYEGQAPIDYADGAFRIDLSEAYDGSVRRAITPDPAANVVRVSDELSLDSPAEVWWFAHTRADVRLSDDSRSADLVQDGKTMRATIVSPAGAEFTVMDAQPLTTSPHPRGQNPHNGSVKTNPAEGARHVARGELPEYGAAEPDQAVRKLAIKLEAVRDATIVVEFARRSPSS